MVDRIRQQILSAIEALPADGSYLLDEVGFASEWRTNPDPTTERSPYDLEATVRIGGATYTGPRSRRHPVGVLLTLAAYSGTRTAADSSEPLSAEGRVQAAAHHVGQALQRLPSSTGYLHLDGWTDPELDNSGLWWDTTVQLTLTVTET